MVFQKDGRLLETSAANLFAVKDGTIFTPPLEEGILPGIIRHLLIERFKAREKTIDTMDLEQYDFCFITNSIMELQPVSGINETIFTAYKAGFEALLARWRLFKEREKMF